METRHTSFTSFLQNMLKNANDFKQSCLRRNCNPALMIGGGGLLKTLLKVKFPSFCQIIKLSFIWIGFKEQCLMVKHSKISKDLVNHWCIIQLPDTQWTDNRILIIFLLPPHNLMSNWEQQRRRNVLFKNLWGPWESLTRKKQDIDHLPAAPTQGIGNNKE